MSLPIIGWPPPHQPHMKHPRTITIQPVLNGFLVKVDCQCVVFTTVDELTRAIGRYYTNPTKVEEEYVAGALNNTLQGPFGMDAIAPVAPVAPAPPMERQR